MNKTIITTIMLFVLLILVQCSSPIDISGLYLCEDRKSGFSIESADGGYRVAFVSISEGRIVETHFCYTTKKSSNNCYRLYTDPEKLNYYDVTANSSGFNGVYRNNEKYFMIRALLRRVDLADDPF